jgi:hypothetical protein
MTSIDTDGHEKIDKEIMNEEMSIWNWLYHCAALFRENSTRASVGVLSIPKVDILATDVCIDRDLSRGTTDTNFNSLLRFFRE